MTEAQTISILLSLVAIFFAILVSLVGWMGGKLYSILEKMYTALSAIREDLHAQIKEIDIRLTILETKDRDRP